MSTDKKYTAREAAVAVLKKAEEVIKKHKHIGWDKMESKLADEGYSKESQDKIAGSIKAKVEKSEGEDTSGSDKEIAHKEHDETPPDHVEKDPTPEEHKDNGNPEWGDEPGTYKLAKFCGHLSAKRGMRKE